MHGAGAALGDAAENRERLVKEEIGNVIGIDFCSFDSGERQLYVSQNGAFDALEQALHLLLDFADVGDVGEGAAAELRHLGGEKEIRCASDRDCVQAGVAEVGVKRGENLLFVAQIAVGQENDVAQIVRRGRLLHQVQQSGQHLGSAAGL